MFGALRRLAAKLRGGDAPAVSGRKLQIQVRDSQDGWINAGSAPADPGELPKRMREALARHGGDRARAIDADGTIVAETGAP